MATKVDKRQVRKEKNAEALGIDLAQVNKEAVEPKKRGIRGYKSWSENRWKWTLFLIEFLLISIMINGVMNR